MAARVHVELVRSLDPLRAILPELATRYSIERIAVFGSFVRGEETEKSDLDLLVRGCPISEAERLQEELSRIAERPVHLVLEEALGRYVGEHVRQEAVDLREPLADALRALEPHRRLVDLRDVLSEIGDLLDRLATDLQTTPIEWVRTGRWPSLLADLRRWGALAHAVPAERWGDLPPVPHRPVEALAVLSEGAEPSSAQALYRLMALAVPRWRQAIPAMIAAETERIAEERRGR
ncbi:MAG: hypothetical protein KatS3mg115_0775 [Candidatus Poribacteria bacterium]|nr:MAG: hypothetical protein KatS3mg115_0775 [Candidatus Poribacteria bacterium]